MKIQLNRSSNILLAPLIPREVYAQLITHLDSLPAHIKRMVVLLILSGIPVNRLCSLTFDSLIRDDYGIWLLRFDNLKRQIKHTIPLSPVAVAMIQEQQQSLNQDQHEVTDLLFLNAKGQAISPKTFMAQLNRLAIKKDIRDATGQVWRFQAHQFRFTFVAQMIKDKVSFDVITHLLDHKEPKTTLRYYHSPQYWM